MFTHPSHVKLYHNFQVFFFFCLLHFGILHPSGKCKILNKPPCAKSAIEVISRVRTHVRLALLCHETGFWCYVVEGWIAKAALRAPHDFSLRATRA